MEKKKNISPSVEEAKLCIGLYNELSAKLSDLSLEETHIVLEEMEKYVKLIVSNFLVYTECVDIMFEYFHKAGQLSPDNDSFDPEIRKHINDIFITIKNDHDAD